VFRKLEGTLEMDAVHESFTSDEICEQAKGNVGALSLLLLAYARDRGQPLADAARYFGQVFAPSWDEVDVRNARTAAWWAGLNMVTGGSELRRLEGDATRAAVTVGGWPTEEDLAYFALSQEEADTLYDLFAPVAERLGLRYSWIRNGEEVTMTFAAMET
jgi:hypothetical protein